MTALPSASSLTGSGITEADFKTQLTNLISYLTGLLDTLGTTISAIQKLGALGNAVLAKGAAYTVVATDRGKLIDCTTGTWTLTLTAAATLGSFAFAVRNSGSGTITIDPNLSETIDGASTIALAAGESCVVVCDGTKFYSVGKTSTPITPAVKQVVSATIAAATGTTSIPDDNTAPLSSEGTQIASLSITPSSASNKVRVRGNFSAVISESNSSGVGQGGLIAAVFRGSTLVGTARTLVEHGNIDDWGANVAFEFEDSPASASALTYTVRVGKHGTSIDSWYVNRSSTSATALASSMANSIFTAEELSA